MNKTFRAWDVDQRWLLPPSVLELVPADHVAHFVRETVREQLDLSAIFATYEEPRSFPEGIPHVLVNGRFVVDGGQPTGDLPGRALRAGR